MIQLVQLWRAEAAMVAQRKVLERASSARLAAEKEAVRKAQEAEARAVQEVEEIRARLASAAGDEAVVLEERLRTLSERAEREHDAVKAARQQATVRSMHHVLRLWEYSRQWRAVVEWRVGVAALTGLPWLVDGASSAMCASGAGRGKKQTHAKGDRKRTGTNARPIPFGWRWRWRWR